MYEKQVPEAEVARQANCVVLRIVYTLGPTIIPKLQSVCGSTIEEAARNFLTEEVARTMDEDATIADLVSCRASGDGLDDWIFFWKGRYVAPVSMPSDIRKAFTPWSLTPEPFSMFNDRVE